MLERVEGSLGSGDVSLVAGAGAEAGWVSVVGAGTVVGQSVGAIALATHGSCARW